MNQIDQLWPGWEVIRVIGQGSFGAVYEIQRNLYGRIESAALKVISIPQSMQEINELRSEGYDDQSITAHFQSYLEEIIREYTVMLDLKGHTNVVYCDDVRCVQRENGFGWDVFIKMELLTPLMNALHKEYDEAQVIRMGIDLCNALILCKNENIIHRDIKPQNIFVSKTGDCKLGDFGVAKISDKTVSGTKIGTYKYMAPEVYLNRPYGTSSDLYSLGLVLYWAMNERRTPFLSLPPQLPKPSEEEEARQRRFSGEPIPAPVHGSRGLQEIVLKACAYDPRDRFRDPAQMREALIRLSAGEKSRYIPEPEAEKTVGVFGVHAPSAPEKQPEDGTVGIFGNAVRQQPGPVKQDGTVGVFGTHTPPVPEKHPEDGKSLSGEELSEIISPYFGGKVTFGTAGDQKPEPVKQTPPVQKPVEPPKSQEEPPKNNKKKIIGIAIAAVAVLVILLIVISSMTGPSQDTDQSSLNLTPKTMTNPISVSETGMAVVKNDGTVLYSGEDDIEEKVAAWTDIISVYCTADCVVGLKADGTVVKAGSFVYLNAEEITQWTGIVELAVGNSHIVGLKSDGTVVAIGNNQYGQCDVSGWTDIVNVEIASAENFDDHTLGLKSDGTVVATGKESFDNLNVGGWTGIVDITGGRWFTAGLKSDGTLVIASDYELSSTYQGSYGQYLPRYEEWTNIVAIDAAEARLVGLTADGRVLETTDEGQLHDVNNVIEMEAIVTSENVTLLHQQGTGDLICFMEDLHEDWPPFVDKIGLWEDIALPRSVYDGVDKNAEHGVDAGEAWAGNVMDNFTANLESVTVESPAFGNAEIPRGEVIAVFFLDSIRTLDEYGIIDTWDVSRKQDGSVMAGAIQDPDGMYQLYIAADGGINGSIACKGLFQSFTGLEAVSFEKAFHTDYTKDMSGMFYGCNDLILVDCENLVTTNVSNMADMFSCCTSLETVDVSGFDTANVTDMSFMFHLCVSLSEAVIQSAIASWDVSAVVNYEGFVASSSYISDDYVDFFEQ